jgi:hypothetical protein
VKPRSAFYWAAIAAAVAGVICLAVGLTSAIGPCQIQENGPAVCADPGAAWTWAGDALIAAAAVTALATAVARWSRRRGI